MCLTFTKSINACVSHRKQTQVLINSGHLRVRLSADLLPHRVTCLSSESKSSQHCAGRRRGHEEVEREWESVGWGVPAVGLDLAESLGHVCCMCHGPRGFHGVKAGRLGHEGGGMCFWDTLINTRGGRETLQVIQAEFSHRL